MKSKLVARDRKSMGGKKMGWETERKMCLKELT